MFFHLEDHKINLTSFKLSFLTNKPVVNKHQVHNMSSPPQTEFSCGLLWLICWWTQDSTVGAQTFYLFIKTQVCANIIVKSQTWVSGKKKKHKKTRGQTWRKIEETNWSLMKERQTGEEWGRHRWGRSGNEGKLQERSGKSEVKKRHRIGQERQWETNEQKPV